MFISNKFELAIGFCFYFLTTVRCKTSQPNIILIIADDLGFNDVGFHGFNQIPTSNIDALAYQGMILNRHYVLPTCTPSRASLMTGKYAIKTGLQGDPDSAESPWNLPINEKILPQYLKTLGYKTHLVGKWHLGFSRQQFTPTERGFDTHFGYFNGWVRYNDSVSTSIFSGYDARRNLQPAAEEVRGKYLTDVYTDEAIKIIRNHDHGSPLFLDLCHVAVHAVKNDILQVADEEENNRRFHYIRDGYRRLFAGVLNSLDESVGKIIEALDEEKLLENSIVVFMADNGGPTIDPDWKFANTASNWPLRGVYFVGDGGVRGAAAVWSPLINKKNKVSNELFHISDWVPTLIAAAGGTIYNDWELDGVNQWPYLTGKQTKSDRNEVLINIDHKKGTYGIISKQWKLLYCNESYNPTFADNYGGIPGRDDSPIPYDMDSVLQSTANQILTKYSPLEEQTRQKFKEIRQSATIDGNCAKRITAGNTPQVNQCQKSRLYNIVKDPCEFENVESKAPAVVQILKARLEYFESVTVPMQLFRPDNRSDPKLHSGYWSWWLDDIVLDTSRGFMVVSSALLGVGTIVFIQIGLVVSRSLLKQ